MSEVTGSGASGGILADSEGATGSEPIVLSIVIPTFNEAPNVAPLVARLHAALGGIAWEAIFVDDDSKDGTAARAREIAQTDRRVRVIRRVGRRGLSSAAIEGFLASSGPVLAVIDGDMQHDETALGAMYRAVAGGEFELAIGTRYTEGGSTGEWDESRVKISRIATLLSQKLLKAEVADPMSGFFAIRRETFERALPQLSSIGFKILLDIIASHPEALRIKEVPYTFRNREHGESKLDSKVVQEFGALLLDKMFGHLIPVRFLMFALVGGLGLFVHLAVLGSLFNFADVQFRTAQATAVFCAMTFNFALNNSFTYRDMRLRGWGILRGLIAFYMVCLVGAIGNVGVAEMVYDLHYRWWLAGLAGTVVGVVWNYAVSSVFTWKK